MMHRTLAACAVVLLLALALWEWRLEAPDSSTTTSPTATETAEIGALPVFLPAEAHVVLRRILANGSHPHRQDGSTFQNRERRLPQRANGYYREYTVPTPGARDRGARRIVTGGDPPVEFWYTADHYRSFRAFEVPR